MARSSLSSSLESSPFDEVSGNLIESCLTSEFQKRLVRYDTGKQLRPQLFEHDYDQSLLDLVDERFDLVKRNGTVATLSNELAATGVYSREGLERERPLEAARMARWEGGLSELREIAVRKGGASF